MNRGVRRDIDFKPAAMMAGAGAPRPAGGRKSAIPHNPKTTPRAGTPAPRTAPAAIGSFRMRNLRSNVSMFLRYFRYVAGRGTIEPSSISIA